MTVNKQFGFGTITGATPIASNRYPLSTLITILKLIYQKCDHIHMPLYLQLRLQIRGISVFLKHDSVDCETCDSHNEETKKSEQTFLFNRPCSSLWSHLSN